MSSKIGTITLPEQARSLRNEINNFQDWLSSRVELNQIPLYDLKIYSRDIDELIDKLEAKKSLFDKKTFTFKSRPVLKVKSTIQTVKPEQEQLQEQKKLTQKQTLENIRNYKMVLEVSDNDDHNIYIKNIENSIILIEKSVKTLTLEDIKNSIILADSETFIFTNNLTDSILQGSCQQLRVHNTHNSIINVNITSGMNRFVIEDSNNLYVFNRKGLEVDDFNHPSINLANNPHILISSKYKLDPKCLDQFPNGLIDSEQLKKLFLSVI